MVPETPPRENLYGLPPEELARLLSGLDPRPFRARQVFSWMHRHDVLDPHDWTNLPRALRDEISRRFTVARPRVVAESRASDGTVKAVLGLPGGGRVEAVAMPWDDHDTFCLSSQVGCAFGCAFCMTGRLGFRRHLSSGEIAGQVAALREATGLGRGVLNLVLMGMGEPLHNLDAVLPALDVLVHGEGFGIPPRRITVSTVGLPAGIRRLAAEGPPVRLAVSLVSARRATRQRLVPAARRHSLDELAEAIRDFGARGRHRPTLEVVLLRDVNDSPAEIHELARFARRTRSKVNLIEFNPVPELPFAPSPEDRVERALRILSGAGVVATVRRSRGRDAAAACGQLAFLGRNEGEA